MDELPIVEWVAPQPRELPGIREDLADQMSSRFIYTQTVELMRENRGTVVPVPGDPKASALFLLSEEQARLQAARLYSVSAEMTQIAIAAGQKLPSWNVRPEDIPSMSGLMFFDEPIGHYATHSGAEGPRIVSIVAASWGRTGYGGDPDGGRWVTFWSLTHQDLGVEALRRVLEMSHRKATERQAMLGRFSWDNEALLTFHSNKVHIHSGGLGQLIDPSEAHLTSGTTLRFVQTVRAAWLLMKPDGKRPIAEVVDSPLSRTVRRQAERDGYDSNPVRIVTLHKQRRSNNAAPAGERKMKVRAHVSGHVRWQPYPSKGVIEPIWIADHVRGPDGAPFSRPTVTVLNRPPGGKR
jgi:hypothetical protein